MKNTNSPWFFAEQKGRKYITPEDITAAVEAGFGKLELCQAVLEAVEMGALEDSSCCAFVALRHLKNG